MNYTDLTAQQSGAILSEYLPHKVQVQKILFKEPRQGELVGLQYDDKSVYASVLRPGELEYDSLANNIMPVLYDLADLPKLLRRATDNATPLVVALRKMSFTTSLDLAAGEGVIAAEVLPNQWGKMADRTVLLHLRVLTDYIDPDSRQEGEGCEYEVTLSAFGEVLWRNVTADKLSIDEAGRTGRGHWQHVHGTHLMRAWEYLRELHVAVGAVAEIKQRYIEATGQHETHYRYVRKQLPQQEANGEETDRA